VPGCECLGNVRVVHHVPSANDPTHWLAFLAMPDEWTLWRGVSDSLIGTYRRTEGAAAVPAELVVEEWKPIA
jgi:hypothetical protein